MNRPVFKRTTPYSGQNCPSSEDSFEADNRAVDPSSHSLCSSGFPKAAPPVSTWGWDFRDKSAWLDLEMGLDRGSVPKLVLQCCSWCCTIGLCLCSVFYIATRWDRHLGNCLRKWKVKGNSCLSVLFQHLRWWKLAFPAEFIRTKPFCASWESGLGRVWLIFICNSN